MCVGLFVFVAGESMSRTRPNEALFISLFWDWDSSVLDCTSETKQQQEEAREEKKREADELKSTNHTSFR